MGEARCSITQKRFLRGLQTLTIEGNKLTIEHKRGLSLYEYRLNLQGLLPESVRIRRVPMDMIVVLTLSSTLGLALVPIGILTETIREGTAVIAGIGMIFLIFAMIGWIPTLRRITNVVIFQGPAGGVVLWPNRPDKDAFDAFVAVLTARIRSAQSYEQALLGQLRQAGILDDWQYDQAAELIGQRADQPAGQ